MKIFASENKIRTNLLIIINNELNEYKSKKNKSFLINSKPIKEYEKSYEKFFIIEKNSITGTVGTYHKETYSYNFYKIPLKKNLPPNEEIEIPTQKKTLAKHFECKVKRKKTRKLSVFSKIRYETQKKLIFNSIKSLRYFCYHLKDYKYKETKIFHSKSPITRRKKYNKIGSNSYILAVKTFELKEEKKKKYRQSVIQLQKIWSDNKVKSSLKEENLNFFDRNQQVNIINERNYKNNILLFND